MQHYGLRKSFICNSSQAIDDYKTLVEATRRTPGRNVGKSLAVLAKLEKDAIDRAAEAGGPVPRGP
eukprot:677515-Lingulodinium_polyedra.AAC.1